MRDETTFLTADAQIVQIVNTYLAALEDLVVFLETDQKPSCRDKTILVDSMVKYLSLPPR